MNRLPRITCTACGKHNLQRPVHGMCRPCYYKQERIKRGNCKMMYCTGLQVADGYCRACIRRQARKRPQRCSIPGCRLMQPQDANTGTLCRDCYRASKRVGNKNTFFKVKRPATSRQLQHDVQEALLDRLQEIAPDDPITRLIMHHERPPKIAL